MPTIAYPHRRSDRPMSDPQDAIAGAESTRSLRSRIHTFRHRGAMTRALAEGADPATHPELAPRAARLTSERNRRGLARTLRHIVDEAHHPIVGFRMVLIRRRPVIETEDLINALSERLRSPAPVRAQGMAELERILSNADQSPLYNNSEAGALRAQLIAVLEALEPAGPQSHEFPISA